jgi:histidinol dehydrogenase
MDSNGLTRFVLEKPEDRSALTRRIRRHAVSDPEVDTRVRAILDAVERDGDAAVARWTQELDGRSPKAGSFELKWAERQRRTATVEPTVRAALEQAAERIRRFHLPQLDALDGYAQGSLELRSLPLTRIGLYVPGGTARYPSSVLMTAIPARLAGVSELIMVTPGASPETLFAAELARIDRVFEIGGAQAIAALAFGTETVPRVDKIVGPGNLWVAAAKRLVFGAVDIDSVAGPSEVLIIADDSARASWIAADLLAQAEHDGEARVVLVTPSVELADRVDVELKKQLRDLPRGKIAGQAVKVHGTAVICKDIAEGVRFANDYAPEHLELLIDAPEAWVHEIHNAGAVFVGEYSLEAAGDYVAGPNHVLPTAGAARFASPLGVYHFRKWSSVVALSRRDLGELRDSIETLARVEGLDAHARSVAIRFAGDDDE